MPRYKILKLILSLLLIVLSSCASLSGVRLQEPEERAAIVRDINQGGNFRYRVEADDMPGIIVMLGSDNEPERFAGIVLLGQYEGPEKIPLLLRHYYDESIRIQDQIKTLIDEDSDTFLAYVRENLLYVTPEQQRVYLKLFINWGSKTDIDLISELFEQDDSQITISAALAIVELMDADEFINSGMLNDISENKRKSAYLVLGKYDNPALIPVILEGLKDESRQVRNEASFSLNQFGEIILPYLYPLLKEGSDNEVENALYLLIPLHQEESIPYVIPLINEESGKLKEQSLAFIRSFGETAIPYLREKAQNGNRRERLEAVKLLVELNDYDSSGMFLDFLLLNDEALKNVLENALINWDEKIFPFLYRNMEETESRARQSVIWLRNQGDPDLCYNENGDLDITHSLYLLRFSSFGELDYYFSEVSFNVRTAEDFKRFYRLFTQIPQFRQLKSSMTQKDNNLYLYYFRLYEEAQIKSRENMEKSFSLTQSYMDTGSNQYLEQSQAARDAGIRYKEEADYLDSLLQEMKKNPDGGEMLSREYERLRKLITDSWYLAREENRGLAEAVYQWLGLDIQVLLTEELRISP